MSHLIVCTSSEGELGSAEGSETAIRARSYFVEIDTYRSPVAHTPAWCCP